MDVVWKFIDSRSRAKDINQKLHLVWFVFLLLMGKLSQIVTGTAWRSILAPSSKQRKIFFSMPLTGKIQR